MTYRVQLAVRRVEDEPAYLQKLRHSGVARLPCVSIIGRAVYRGWIGSVLRVAVIEGAVSVSRQSDPVSRIGIAFHIAPGKAVSILGGFPDSALRSEKHVSAAVKGDRENVAIIDSVHGIDSGVRRRSHIPRSAIVRGSENAVLLRAHPQIIGCGIQGKRERCIAVGRCGRCRSERLSLHLSRTRPQQWGRGPNTRRTRDSHLQRRHSRSMQGRNRASRPESRSKCRLRHSNDRNRLDEGWDRHLNKFQQTDRRYWDSR